MQYHISPGALAVLEALEQAGHEAFLVGGCVRDLLRGVEPHDWDVCTSALPEQTIACFPQGRAIETGLKHGTVTILLQGEAFEVTTYRSDGAYSDGRHPDTVRFVSQLTEDLARRDFTINAIALGADGQLRDPFGGREDIQRRRICCVGQAERRFQEDGLRIMRALRFASTLGYTVEEHTAQAIHRCRSMLEHVAAERIQTELCKLLTGPGALAVLREYPDVLWVFWPELKPLVGLPQRCPWHCWDGWEHTLYALDAAPANPVLRLAVLLHDVGKPSCASTDEQGRDHFYGHPEVSAQMARVMLRRLRFDNDTLRRVVKLVACHDIVFPPTQRSVRRWLNRLGEEVFFQLLDVKRSDVQGMRGDLIPQRLAGLDELEAAARTVIAQGQCFSLRDLAVDGRDVMAAGIPPGPQVGQVLKALLEKVLNGEAANDRQVLLSLIPQLSGR